MHAQLLSDSPPPTLLSDSYNVHLIGPKHMAKSPISCRTQSTSSRCFSICHPSHRDRAHHAAVRTVTTIAFARARALDSLDLSSEVHSCMGKKWKRRGGRMDIKKEKKGVNGGSAAPSAPISRRMKRKDETAIIYFVGFAQCRPGVSEYTRTILLHYEKGTLLQRFDH